MAQPGSRRRHTGIWIVVTILLAAAIVGPLWVSSYSRATPAAGGFPFFYWYQLIWVPIVAVLSAVAYALTKRAHADGGPGHRGRGEPGRDPGVTR
jgi:membrane protein implicated in regulation of membrane protease activity